MREIQAVGALIINERAQLDAIRGEWNALAEQDKRDGVFRTWEWNVYWLKHCGGDAEPFVVCVYGEEGRLVGLAPLCLSTYRDLGFRLRGVGFLGREIVSGDFLDILALPGYRIPVVGEVLKALADHATAWDIVALGELLADSVTVREARAWAAANGYAVRVEEPRLCPFIGLPGTYEAYLAGLGKNMRYNIRRRTRKLEALSAEIRSASGGREIHRALETLFELHGQRWRSVGQPGSFEQPGFRAFLHEFCESPPKSVDNRLYLLSLNGEPIAGLLVWHYGHAALYYQAGRNVGHGRYSPGVVLMARSISDAIAGDKKYYEFLRGDEAYKGGWTAEHRVTATVVIGRTSRARLYFAAARYRDLGRRVLRGRRRDREPRSG